MAITTDMAAMRADVPPELLCTRCLAGGIRHQFVVNPAGIVESVEAGDAVGRPPVVPPARGLSFLEYLASLGVSIWNADEVKPWVCRSRASALDAFWSGRPGILCVECAPHEHGHWLTVRGAYLAEALAVDALSGGASIERLAQVEHFADEATSETDLWKRVAALVAQDPAYEFLLVTVAGADGAPECYAMVDGTIELLASYKDADPRRMPMHMVSLFASADWPGHGAPHERELAARASAVLTAPLFGGEGITGHVALGISPAFQTEVLDLFSAMRAMATLGQRLAVLRYRAQRTRFERRITQMNADLERQVEARTAELSNANRNLASFTSMVSHDLRAPLQTVSALAELLHRQYETVFPEEALNILALISEGALQAGNLIEAMLRLSRVEQCDVEFDMVDLQAVVSGAAMEVHLEPHILTLDPLPVCYGDRYLLRQLFVNILSNSVKFAGQQDAPQIAVRCEWKDGHSVLHVEDNGPGFEDGQAAAMFAPFKRGHTVTEVPGEGVGLAICERIVARHRGRIWAENRDGGGARVSFTLASDEGNRG